MKDIVDASLFERRGEQDAERVITKVLCELVRPHKLRYEFPGSSLREINVPSLNID